MAKDIYGNTIPDNLGSITANPPTGAENILNPGGGPRYGLTVDGQDTRGPLSPNSAPSPYSSGNIIVTPQTPAAPVTPNTPTTPSEAYGSYIPNETPEERALRLELERQGALAQTGANTPVDEATIRANTLKQFQAEVDALNRIYTEKRRQAAITGSGRLGSDAAVQARRGLIGSTFGGAQTAGVEDVNKQEMDAIAAEEAAASAALQGKIRSSVVEELAAKTKARKEGAESYITFLQGAAERATKRTTDAVKALLASKSSPTEDDLKGLADALGTSVENVKKVYKDYQKQANADKIANYKTLSEGQSIIDPVTGKVISTAPSAPDKPVSLSPGSSLVDNKGNVLYTAPEKPTNPLDYTKVVGDSLWQYDPVKGTWSKQFTEPGKGGDNIVKVNGVDYVQNADGSLSIPKTPASPANPATTENLKQKVNLIDGLLNNPTLGANVGNYGVTRLNINPFNQSQVNEFRAGVKQLISSETLSTLLQLKAAGGTLGAISEKELQILQNSATKINSWQQPDGTYKIGEKEFRAELQRIKDATQRVLDASNQPSTGVTIESLRQEFPQATPEELEALLQEEQGFNKVGNDTNKVALGNLSSKYESGGNPGAIGFDSTGGYSYGTYQLAHNNAQRFVQQSPYANEFRGLAFNSSGWQQKWKDIARRDPQGFDSAQKKYIESTHFQPQVDKLSQLGVDLNKYSNVLKDVIWSTAVQHGGATDIIAKALKQVGKNASESDLIRRIYAIRWSGGQQFASSTEAVKKAVYNRFYGKDGELKKALSMLG